MESEHFLPDKGLLSLDESRWGKLDVPSFETDKELKRRKLLSMTRVTSDRPAILNASVRVGTSQGSLARKTGNWACYSFYFHSMKL